mmetsp:Transcript_59617/g.137841  ORF Transcript_59617/g.137841 Transcript_59617/m.137841 type:complete len:89 (-) Transcript_59617:79-345(-)
MEMDAKLDATFCQVAVSDMWKSAKSGPHAPPTAPPAGSSFAAKDAADFGGLRQQQLQNPLELIGRLSFSLAGPFVLLLKAWCPTLGRT